MTVRETALAALATLLTTTFGALGADAGKFVRDPEKTPDEETDGLIIMRDGDPGDPEVSLSPVQYAFQHQVFLEFSTTGTDRGSKLDALLAQFDTALSGSRQLGGTVIDARVMLAPVIDEVDVEGATTVRAATVMVQLFYVTNSPLG